MVSMDSFEFDPNWPPKNVKWVWSRFSETEDKLILEYLLKRHQFNTLGGNEVWKKMATSRKFNPGARTFHSLRERYCKYLKCRLGRYLPPEQQELLLGKAAGTLSKPRKMTSKTDALDERKLALRSPVSILKSSNSIDDESAEQVIAGDQVACASSNDIRFASALRERADLLAMSKAKNSIVVTSTSVAPMRTNYRAIEGPEKCLQEAVDNQTGRVKESLNSSEATKARNKPKTTTTTASAALHAVEALPLSQGDQPAVPLKEETCGDEQAAIRKDNSRVVRIRVSNNSEFHFEFKNAHVVSDPTNLSAPAIILSYAQNQLRDVLLGHAKCLENCDWLHCPKENCVGLQTYLDCWVDLQKAQFKVEQHKDQGAQAFFKRVLANRVNDLVAVPVCTCKSSYFNLEQLDPEQLYGFFCDASTAEASETLHRLLDTTRTLRNALLNTV